MSHLTLDNYHMLPPRQRLDTLISGLTGRRMGASIALRLFPSKGTSSDASPDGDLIASIT